MQMNLGLLGILLFFSLGILKSQNEFAPIGAEWHFNRDFDLNTFQEEYSIYKVVKDTTINGQVCRKIDGTLYLKDSTITNGLALFVLQRNDSVFYFNNRFHDFKLLYSFKAKPGDTLTLSTPYVLDAIPNDTIFREVVDSVVLKDFAGQKLQFFYTHPLDKWSFSGFGNRGVYAERIGNLYQPFFSSPFVSLVFQYVRCYQDKDVFVKFFDKACDFRLSTGVGNLNNSYDIKIYPNPGSQFIAVESKALILDEVFISIYDVNGKALISKQKLNKSGLIDISSLSPGVYTLMIDAKNNYTLKKIIKM